MTNKNEMEEPLLASKRISSRELDAIHEIRTCFEGIEMPWSDRVANFTNWARTRDVTRFLARYHLFQKILDVPGCIFECGVHWGGGVSSWLHLSEIFEPVAFTRRVYAFDTYTGFPDVNPEDMSSVHKPKVGDFDLGGSAGYVKGTLKAIEQTRKVGNVDRLQIVEGDVCKTMQETLDSDYSISIALLYLDVDLYEPTMKVLEACLPRMPKGSIVVFDEYADRVWPGETKALLDSIGISNVRMKCFPWCPRISYFEVE